MQHATVHAVHSHTSSGVRARFGFLACLFGRLAGCFLGFASSLASLSDTSTAAGSESDGSAAGSLTFSLALPSVRCLGACPPLLSFTFNEGFPGLSPPPSALTISMHFRPSFTGWCLLLQYRTSSPCTWIHADFGYLPRSRKHRLWKDVHLLQAFTSPRKLASRCTRYDARSQHPAAFSVQMWSVNISLAAEGHVCYPIYDIM